MRSQLPVVVALASVAAVTCVSMAAPGAVRLDLPGGPAETLAREELAAYLNRLKRTGLAIQTAAGLGQIDEIVVALQGSTAVEKANPPLPPLGHESYMMAVRGERLYLVGADDRAVLYAVYEFCHRLGSRWLAPAFEFYQGHHEYLPDRGMAEIDLSKDIVCTPVLRYRKLYVEEGHSHDEAGLRQIIAWMPKLRFNTLVIPIDYQGRGRVRWDNWRAALAPELQRRGITIEVGGHGYQNFLNAGMEDGELFRKHSDWFAMDTAGRRTTEPRWVPCTSNADAVAALQRKVIAYLRERPEIEIFDFWPPDGARWCECGPCKALGSPSERHALLVSATAAALARELPKVRVECIAYASYLEPPARNAIDKAVLVDLCPIGQCFEVPIHDPGNEANRKYAEALRAWRKSFEGDISIYSYYRKYAWNSLPNVIPHYMQEDLRWYRGVGVAGVSTYAEPGDWFTYELNHYVLGHLAWDPDTNVDAIIDEFCAARYGPEAKLAREVFAGLESMVRHACSLPGTSMKTVAEQQAYQAKLESLRLKVMAARERQSDEVLRMHLRRLGLMLDYAARDATIQWHRTAGRPEAERRTVVDELAAFCREHASEGVILPHARWERTRLYGHYEPVPRRQVRSASRPSPVSRPSAKN